MCPVATPKLFGMVMIDGESSDSFHVAFVSKVYKIFSE